MPLKPQDLETFEAYKKAMRAAAGHIGDNTPFCIYSDVQMPDASKRLHTLRPFLVLGTPAGAVAPMLKDLHGSKALACAGVCSMEEGKIQLTAKSGKVNYGIFKSQSTVFKELLGKEILIPANGGSAAPAKETEKSIPAPPFGKLTYFGSHEKEVLAGLTEAVKGFTKVGDMDGQLREHFQVMDKFSKSIPPLDVVKAEFAKIEPAVKAEAQTLQDIETTVKVIYALLVQISRAANAAHKNLQITEDELKAASDLQKARDLRSRLDIGPLFKCITSVNSAVGAFAKAEEDPIGAVGAAFDATQNLLTLFGLDKLNQQIAALEAEANQLQWKAAIAKFKLAQQNLRDVFETRDNLRGPFEKAKSQYASRKKNLPQDFDAFNKRGKFHFESMTKLSNMLKDYRQFAQQAVTSAYHISESIHTLQGSLGTAWMANPTQDKDILEKMFTVTKRALERAIHERDGADNHIKIVQKQVDELEVILSKTRLKVG